MKENIKKKHKTLYVSSWDGESPRLCMKKDKYADSNREAGPKDITIDAIAEMLDHDAENGNYHDFVGCHHKLSMLLSARCGQAIAKEIMRDLCDIGGLHGIRN